MPDGRLGSGDGLFLGQALHAGDIDDLLKVDLGEAVLSDPSNLFAGALVFLEVVRLSAWETAPACDLQIDAELDIDVEFDAVSLDVALSALAGVNPEQLSGHYAAVLGHHVIAADAVLGHSELREACRVTIFGVIRVSGLSAKGKGCCEYRSD